MWIKRLLTQFLFKRGYFEIRRLFWSQHMDTHIHTQRKNTFTAWIILCEFTQLCPSCQQRELYRFYTLYYSPTMCIKYEMNKKEPKNYSVSWHEADFSEIMQSVAGCQAPSGAQRKTQKDTLFYHIISCSVSGHSLLSYTVKLNLDILLFVRE